MNALLLIIGILFNVFLGAIVLLRRREPAARALLLVAVGLIIWETANYFADTSSANTLFWNRITFAGPLLVMLASHLFILNLRERTLSGRMGAFLTIGTVATLICVALPFVVTDVVVRADGGYNPVYGWAYPLYLVWIMVLVFVFLRNTFTNKPRDSAQRKQQLRIVRIGAASAIALPLITNALLPLILGSSASAQLVPLTSIIYISALSIAILKHGLLDVRLAAARSIAYALVLITLSIIYYVFAYLLSFAFLDKNADFALVTSPVSMAIALVLAFVFQPVKRFFDRISNRIFYRAGYDASAFFARINELLARTTTLQTLLRRTSIEIATTLKSQQVYIVVRHSHNDQITRGGTKYYTSIPAADINELDTYFGTTTIDILIKSALDQEDPLYRLMVSHKTALLLPLYLKNTPIGYIGIGERQSGGYSSRDLKTLGVIPDELVIAVENALSIQEIQELNESLQQKIDDATKELRASNAQLRKLDEAKDEFISMASHQLRTPLTSIKGYVDMMLEGDAGEVTPMQRKFLTEAFVSSERMVHLINDFLNVSRLQTGKFIIDKHPIDLAKVVGQELDSLKVSATGRDLSFQYKMPKTIPQLMLDEGKIRQVIMNFADNALYYSRPKSKITVTLAMKDDDVILEVIDTGIGVPEAEQQQLFSKFYRASNARKQRPDGTGVGLYLAKRVIMEHGGSVIFSSVEGKGSTFGFRLPLKRLSVHDNANELVDQPADK